MQPQGVFLRMREQMERFLETTPAAFNAFSVPQKHDSVLENALRPHEYFRHFGVPLSSSSRVARL